MMKERYTLRVGVGVEHTIIDYSMEGVKEQAKEFLVDLQSKYPDDIPSPTDNPLAFEDYFEKQCDIYPRPVTCAEYEDAFSLREAHGNTFIYYVYKNINEPMGAILNLAFTEKELKDVMTALETLECFDSQLTEVINLGMGYED